MWSNQKTWINKKYLLSAYCRWEVTRFCDSCSCQAKSHSSCTRQHDSNLLACLQAPWRKEEPVEFKKRESTFHLLFLKIIETNEGGTSCHLPLYVGIDTTLKQAISIVEGCWGGVLGGCLCAGSGVLAWMWRSNRNFKCPSSTFNLAFKIMAPIKTGVNQSDQVGWPGPMHLLASPSPGWDSKCEPPYLAVHMGVGEQTQVFLLLWKMIS